MTGKTKSRRWVFRFQDLWGQLFCLLLFWSLFLLGGLTAVSRREGGVAVLPCLAFLFFALLTCFCGFALCFVVRSKTRGLAAWWQKHWPLIILLEASVILRLPQLGDMICNDSAVYYDALYHCCQQFSFSFSYWLHNFCLVAHPAYGYASLAAVPEFFWPGRFSNIWIAQTLLALLAVYCVYDMALYHWPGQKGKAFCLGALFSVCPMFLGLTSYFQVDFGLAVGVFYLAWAFYRKKYLLLVAAAFLLVFSKEFGITVLCGFFVGTSLQYLLAGKGSFKARCLDWVRQKRFLILLLLCLAGGMTLIYYIFFSGLAWIDVGLIAQDHEASMIGYIGLEPGYILYKLVQVFCVDLAWLICPLLVCCLWRRLWRGSDRGRKRDTVDDFAAVCAGLCCSGVWYFLFSCVMVTYTIPRYDLILQMLLWFFAALLLAALTRGRAFYALSLAAVLLGSVQAYVSVDPLMYLLYPKLDTGGLPIVFTDYSNSDYTGDYIVYNHQYTCFAKAIRSIFRQEGYDENTDAVVVGREMGLRLGGDSALIYGWNVREEDWAMCGTADTVNIRYLASVDHDLMGQWYRDQGLLRRAIFIQLPYFEGREAETEQILSDYYTNVRKGTCDTGLHGEVTYYVADLIQ